MTVDPAPWVSPEGRTVAVDCFKPVIREACGHRSSARADIELDAADAFALPCEVASFGVMKARTLLQHLSEPVRALTELHVGSAA